MKDKNEKNLIKSNVLLALLATAILTTAVTTTVTAKSLYVIADILGASESNVQPVQAYDIGVDGTLTFQAQHDIPHSMLGAVGMAIDSDSGYIFITYENGNDIQLLDPLKMANAGRITAPDATDLAGIVYDHEKGLLYTVDRRINNLYVYNWFPETTTLTHVPGSPFALRNARAYGIALNEIDDLLYVANASNTVTVYRTSDWNLVNSITLSRIAISIAIDVKNGFLYTGGGYAGNMFLTQYHLATGTEKEVQVEPDAGVMGLAVDADTGLIYLNTGMNNQPGGDNLLVYDKALNQIDIVAAIGNPTGLAIPGKNIGYNPLNLKKQVLRGASAGAGPDEMKTVTPGDTFTYGIYFDNNNNYKVTDVTIVDTLPKEVTFVTADDDGVNGFYHYDEQTRIQTYTWTYKELPPGTSTLLEITVQVNPDIDAGTIIKNSVTINTNETPPTTTSVDILTTTNALNLKKGILGTPEGQITQVNTNDIITYIIEFDNKENDFPVTNVRVVDALSKDVTFLRARDETGKAVGKYDDKTNTYTWTFDSLASGAVVHLEIDVSVNPGLPLGTTITNIVTVDSDETPQSSASVDAVMYYKPLNVAKKALDMAGNKIEWVDPNERFTYQICFDNNDNDSKVTDVIILDELPDEVTFVEAHNGKAVGKYDPKTHTYTWLYGSLDPGLTDCFELVVDVKPDTDLDTTIHNSVTIDSNETLPSTAVHDLPVGEVSIKLDNEDLSVTPNVLRRNGTSRNIMVVIYPKEFKKSHIDQNSQPELYYQDRNSRTENFIYIEKGRQSLSGSENRPKITILFNRAKLMDELYGYGEFKLRVMGKLKIENIDRIYFGDVKINVTRFAGD
jgi:fimbrial isopeptide formation D2 family protein